MQVEPVQSSGSVNLISPILRIFGYNRAVARTNSHFGGVEEGTEFAVSDLRSLRRIKTNYLICVCVRCKGDESHLLHCPHTALRSCGIAEVAGVTCIQNEGDRMEGFLEFVKTINQ